MDPDNPGPNDDKTRRLKKYEAESRPVATETHDGRSVDFYSPFGPWLARTTVPGALVDELNAWADGRCTPGTSSEFNVPESLVFAAGESSLGHLTGRFIAQYLARVEGVEVERLQFENFWIVSQFAGSPSPVHFHSADISGVLYLKVPEIENEAEQEQRTYISGREAGYINFLSGGKQKYARSLISFRPEVGDFYVFPGWLLHGAEPFRGTGERRSMAFNAIAP